MALLQRSKCSFNQIANLPVYDFLAPSFFHQISSKPRYLSTSPRLSSEAGPYSAQTNPTKIPQSAIEATKNPSPPSKPLTQAQRDFLTSALRVNQAGELAATLIYTSQTPVVTNAHPHLRPLMKHMYDQEAGHFSTMNELLAKHRIRPTAMYPIWTIAASALGWGTAMMGREAAMACTEAVETEIGTHYNQQVGVLLEMAREMERNGEEMGEELRELTETIRRIRDEELEHLDHAVDNDAKQAVPHELLTGIIRAGCRGAIWITEKV